MPHCTLLYPERGTLEGPLLSIYLVCGPCPAWTRPEKITLFPPFVPLIRCLAQRRTSGLAVPAVRLAPPDLFDRLVT